MYVCMYVCMCVCVCVCVCNKKLESTTPCKKKTTELRDGCVSRYEVITEEILNFTAIEYIPGVSSSTSFESHTSGDELEHPYIKITIF